MTAGSPPENAALTRLRELGGVASSAELQARLGVSQATVSRLLAPLLRSGRVLKVGAARSQRYLLPRAIELASRIARQAPLGVQASLMSARLARLEGEAVAAAALPPLVAQLFNSEDAKEGVRAMLEKRPGVFRGI